MSTETIATMKEQTVEKLQELVQINIDSAKGFEEAADQLTNSQLVSLCRELASQRRQQAKELTQHVHMNGEVAPKEGSFLAAVHRCWMNCRKLFSSDDEYAVLAEAEYGEDQIKEAYEEALVETAGSPLNSVLANQFVDVKAGHDRIRDLRDARK